MRSIWRACGQRFVCSTRKCADFPSPSLFTPPPPSPVLAPPPLYFPHPYCLPPIHVPSSLVPPPPPSLCSTAPVCPYPPSRSPPRVPKAIHSISASPSRIRSSHFLPAIPTAASAIPSPQLAWRVRAVELAASTVCVRVTCCSRPISQMSPHSDGLVTETDLMTITGADFPSVAELEQSEREGTAIVA